MRFLERVSPEHADDLGLQMLQASHLLSRQPKRAPGRLLAERTHARACLSCFHRVLLGNAFHQGSAHVVWPCHRGSWHEACAVK